MSLFCKVIEKMPTSTSLHPNKSGSPRRRNPEMYYGQVWIDRQMFDNIRLFADWEKLSKKAAVYQLLVWGLHFYCVQQLRLE